MRFTVSREAAQGTVWSPTPPPSARVPSQAPVARPVASGRGRALIDAGSRSLTRTRGAGPLFRNCWASHCLLVMSREGAELAERTVAVADEIDTVFPARFRGFTPTRYARRVTSRLQETRVMREPALTAAPPCEYRRNWTLRAAEKAMCDVACRR